MAFNSAYGGNNGYIGSQAHIEFERRKASRNADTAARKAQQAGYDEGYNDASREWQTAYNKLKAQHEDVRDASIHNYKFGDQCKAEIAQLKQQLTQWQQYANEQAQQVAQLQQTNQQLQQQNQALQAQCDERVEKHNDLVRRYNFSQDELGLHAAIRATAMDVFTELERQGRFSDNDYAELFMPSLRNIEQIYMDNNDYDAPLLQCENTLNVMNKRCPHVKAFLQHAEAQAQQAIKRKQPSQNYVMQR